MAEAKWEKAGPLADLEKKGRTVVKLDGKQIMLLHSAGKVFAFNNRCLQNKCLEFGHDRDVSQNPIHRVIRADIKTFDYF